MLVIQDIWAVGMHHWGGRSLALAAGYKIEWDENNLKDPSSRCIKEDGKIKTYLEREHAFIASTLIKRGIWRDWLLKPKEEPVINTHIVDPQQKCNFGCKCTDQSHEEATTYLKKLGFFYQVKTFQNDMNTKFNVHYFNWINKCKKNIYNLCLFCQIKRVKTLNYQSYTCRSTFSQRNGPLPQRKAAKYSTSQSKWPHQR